METRLIEATAKARDLHSALRYTVTREQGKFGPLWIVNGIDCARTFFRAQDAADWLEQYLPGQQAEWRVKHVTASDMDAVAAFMDRTALLPEEGDV